MRFAYLAAGTAAATFLAAPAAEAAFVVEAAAGGKASANYAFTGPGGSVASTSSTGVFAPGTSIGIGSIFGGDGNPDQYTFNYTPALDADNTTFLADEVLNSFWNPDGVDDDEPLLATGLVGGGAGLYNVYITYPQSANYSDGVGEVTVVASGDEGDATYVVAQDADQPLSGSLDTGVAIGLWELIGQVAITDPNATYTITQTSVDDPGFVSMRGFGVMWEFAGDLPSPGLPGDANNDGTVDLADFGILRSEFGMGGGMLQADFNDDGTVDLADFGILRANFGSTADVGALDAWASTIPEPTMLGLAGVAGLALMRRRR